MSALDTLRDITRDRYSTEVTLVRCSTINEIADEIEEELNELRCKVEHVDWRLVASEILYKPADGNIQSIIQWLDKWYIPRPLDADGEPIRFGDLFEYKGKGKLEKIPVTGFRFYVRQKEDASEGGGVDGWILRNRQKHEEDSRHRRDCVEGGMGSRAYLLRHGAIRGRSGRNVVLARRMRQIRRMPSR